MKAMILAAGKGTRVAPFTLKTPKPMLKVMEKPVVDSQLDFLKSNGITEVMLNTSYLGEKIQDYLGNGSRYDMSFTYSFEGFTTNNELISEPLGSAGGLREMQRKYQCFNETFMVICGDALIDFDLNAFVSQHKARGSLATVLIKEVPEHRVSAYGVVSMSTAGKINRFQEKPSLADAISRKVSTGVYLFEPEIFEHIPNHGQYDIGGELLPALANNDNRIFGCEIPMQWIDIGNTFDLWTANMMALYQRSSKSTIRDREVKPGVFAAHNVIANWNNVHIQGPAYIGSGTQIEDNACIFGPSIIGENSLIESGAQLNNVIIAPYTRIGADCISHRQWLSSHYIIDIHENSSCLCNKIDNRFTSDVRESTRFNNTSMLRKCSSA